MSRKPPPSPPDEPDLWARVVADVVPLKGRARKSAVPAEGGRPASLPASPASSPQDGRPHAGPSVGGPVLARPGPARTEARGRELDRRTQQKFTRGQMDIEATLDLHGHGQGEARERLHAFLERAHARGMRCVLVITGKGRGGAGILRARLPEWVEERPLDMLVLRATTARPEHGGAGAFYVLLRRKRDKPL